MQVAGLRKSRILTRTHEQLHPPPIPLVRPARQCVVDRNPITSRTEDGLVVDFEKEARPFLSLQRSLNKLDLAETNLSGNDIDYLSSLWRIS